MAKVKKKSTAPVQEDNLDTKEQVQEGETDARERDESNENDTTHIDTQAPETDVQERDEEDQGEGQAPVVEKQQLTISNPTNTPRGVQLKKGTVVLRPGEVRIVPDDEADEIRALFRSRSFQKLVDSGLFRVSGLGDEELISQKTPEPPKELVDSVTVKDTGLRVGASADRNYNPDSGQKLKVVGHQAGGTVTVG